MQPCCQYNRYLWTTNTINKYVWWLKANHNKEQ